MTCHDVFFNCTADLAGQVNGNGQKGMLQIDAPPSKISGYAAGLLCCVGHAVELCSDTHANVTSSSVL